MHFYATERVALFIDGANLHAATKSLGFDIDFKRLLALFAEKARLVRALYYTALVEDQEFSSLRPLVDHRRLCDEARHHTDAFAPLLDGGDQTAEIRHADWHRR